MSMHPMNTARTPDGGVPGRRTLRQILRYGIIGVAQNALAYGVYLVLTWLGLDPKLVVGVTYPLAMLISFLGNRKYTFAHKGSVSRAGLRFLLAHAASYGINLGMLYVLVDRMRYPHQLVQLAAIFVCAAFLFVTLKFFVFRSVAARTEQGAS